MSEFKIKNKSILFSLNLASKNTRDIYFKLNPKKKKLSKDLTYICQKNQVPTNARIRNGKKNSEETENQIRLYKQIYNINKNPYLNKEDLINILYEKYPTLMSIKKTGYIQYKQFISFFFNIIVNGCNESQYPEKPYLLNNNNGIISFLPNRINNQFINNLNDNKSLRPYSLDNIVRYTINNLPCYPHIPYLQKSNIPDVPFNVRTTTLPIFTKQQFIILSDILYPRFIDLLPDFYQKLLDEIDRTESLNRKGLSTNKLKNYLMSMGNALSKMTWDDELPKNKEKVDKFLKNKEIFLKKINNYEIQKYKYNFYFNKFQIIKFINNLNYEQLKNILTFTTVSYLKSLSKFQKDIIKQNILKLSESESTDEI